MRLPLDTAEGPTRLVRLPTQFDGPTSAPTLATPTCCCCCCCLTTMLSAPIVWGSLAADDAHKHARPSGGPVLLAVFAAPGGVLAGVILSQAADGLGLVGFLGAMFAMLGGAFITAGRQAGSSWGRAALVMLATGGIFVAEVVASLGLIAAVGGSDNGDGGLGVALYGLLILAGLAGAIVYAVRRANWRKANPPGQALPYGMPGTAWPPPSPYGGPVANPGWMGEPPGAGPYWQPTPGPTGHGVPGPPGPPGSPSHAAGPMAPPPVVIPPARPGPGGPGTWAPPSGPPVEPADSPWDGPPMGDAPPRFIPPERPLGPPTDDDPPHR